MDITIRRAKKKDAPRLRELLEIIARLHHEGRPDIYADGGSKYTVKDIEKKLTNEDEIIFVAVDENDYVLGYTMSKIKDVEENGILKGYKNLYIDDVCVDEKFRHNGIGKRLLLKTKEYAIEQKCHNADLNVWAFNHQAIEFYKSCGMTEERIYMEFILD